MTVPMLHPITPEWRAGVIAKMEEAGLKAHALAQLVGTSQAAIAHVLTRAKASAFVPRIDVALAKSAMRPANSEARRAIGAPTARPQERRPAVVSMEPDVIAEIAVLREGCDALTDDIKRLEAVQANVAERLAEAYEHRAKLEIEMRRLRAGAEP